MIRAFMGKRPRIHDSAFVAENATLIGDVEVGPESSVWFGVVLRGDFYPIRIGAQCSVQDNTVIHVTHDRFPTQIGDKVNIGHQVTLHGCVIGSLCIIGMGSIVLDGAEIGERSILGAGALVTPGTKIPPGSLALGTPARVRRALTEEELQWLESSAAHYAALTRMYKENPPEP